MDGLNEKYSLIWSLWDIWGWVFAVASISIFIANVKVHGFRLLHVFLIALVPALICTLFPFREIGRNLIVMQNLCSQFGITIHEAPKPFQTIEANRELSRWELDQAKLIFYEITNSERRAQCIAPHVFFVIRAVSDFLKLIRAVFY